MKNNLKRELMAELGKNFALEGNNIVKVSVEGFDPARNIAQVREVKGVLYVNRYRGYFYKSGEEKSFTSVADALEYILKGGE